jgi:hypothetical protein
MREHTHEASKRRDDGLARIRKVTFWITGGAAAASLGLGTAFAQQLPGHSGTATSAGTSATIGGAPRTGASAQSGASGRAGGSGGRTSGRQHQHALAKPKQAPQQPASNPAPPPVVSSGGS